jgi:hypothetical protein
MQYFQGPKTKQMVGRSRLLVAEVAVAFVAADAAGVAASALTPTVPAASAGSISILSLCIVSSCCVGLYVRPV